MAKPKKEGGNNWKPKLGQRRSKRTSIGRGKNSRPKNKHTRRNHKKYRGQGR
jgi:hypothetical protein